MMLQKENVVKVATSKRAIDYWKSKGFTEVKPLAKNSGETNRGENENGQGAGTPAPSSVSDDAATPERDVIKAKLDELGVEYRANAPTEKLKGILENALKDDAK